MTLEGCCRGSLIMHGKVKAVVVSVRNLPTSENTIYRCARLMGDGEILVEGGITFYEGDEVDCCFPGPVLEVPDFLK